MSTREPAVAGQFYELGKEKLVKQLEDCFSLAGKPGRCSNKNSIAAAICPHAGYMYSGSVAAYSYKALAEDRNIETAVILGPNHTGIGPGVSVFPEGKWETPLGSVEVNSKLAEKIGSLEPDESAHAAEHSIEVQLPFLQLVCKKFKIVPICIADQDPELMISLGKSLAEALDPKKHVVIASTDFSHYVPYDTAYANDFKAIDAIKKLDPELLYKKISDFDVSMCGPGPVAAAMAYAKAAGAKKAELLKYATSGDITGEKSAVVGYASLVFKKA